MATPQEICIALVKSIAEVDDAAWDPLYDLLMENGHDWIAFSHCSKGAERQREWLCEMLWDVGEVEEEQVSSNCARFLVWLWGPDIFKACLEFAARRHRRSPWQDPVWVDKMLKLYG